MLITLFFTLHHHISYFYKKIKIRFPILNFLNCQLNLVASSVHLHSTNKMLRLLLFLLTFYGSFSLVHRHRNVVRVTSASLPAPMQYGLKAFPIEHPKCLFTHHLHEGMSRSMSVTSTAGSLPLQESKSSSPLSHLSVLWRFTRPHTVLGSGLSVFCIYCFSCPSRLWMTPLFFQSLASSTAPALLMNLYITGLNQVTDVQIDKVNKPYLPIAAGDLSLSNGIAIITLSLIISVLMGLKSSWPLQLVLFGSGILGTLYSMPPFRLKRFPLLAAFSITTVRGALINLGFFFQAKKEVMGLALPSFLGACSAFPEAVTMSIFFAIFGIVIALMKDTPDVEGDRLFSIPSFSVRRGAKPMFKFSLIVLCVLLSITGGAFISHSQFLPHSSTQSLVTRSTRTAIGGVLIALAVDLIRRYQIVDKKNPESIFDCYMWVWNVFYACYALLPFSSL